MSGKPRNGQWSHARVLLALANPPCHAVIWRLPPAMFPSSRHPPARRGAGTAFVQKRFVNLLEWPDAGSDPLAWCGLLEGRKIRNGAALVRAAVPCP